VEPLELFFDLVFVFAITQVTARLADDASWTGLLQGGLVLSSIWWAWGAYAWLTNEVDTSRTAVRLTIAASMAAMLVAGLAIPGALEDDARVFAVSYLVVRALHLAMFVAGTDDLDVRRAVRTLAPTALLAPLVLLTSSTLDGAAQVSLWVVALTVDYVGGGLRGIAGWRISASHFAERHGLVIIIALGESIVALGVGAADVALDRSTITAAVLGMVVVAALWATYVDGAPERVQERLAALPGGRQRNAAARDAYSFLHLPMVGGIVLLALGVKKALAHVHDPLELVPAVALCGGVACYLVAQVAFRLRCGEPLEPQRIGAAVLCGALIPVLTAVPALGGLAVLAGLCSALLVYESVREVVAGRVQRPARSRGAA
jgi:low temperature requirement protein LtrA